MKFPLYTIIFLLSLLVIGCFPTRVDSPEPIIDPKSLVLVSSDSIGVGQYLGLGVGVQAPAVYQAIQQLTSTEGITSINIVGNSTHDLETIASRLPLYQYILLDENKGTDSGLQITLEMAQVKSLYLNSGQALSRWPASGSVSISLGDKADELHEKLRQIKKNNAFASKFERILLLTKDLSKAYDPAMAQAAQWYFRYSPQPGQYEEVQLFFVNGYLKYLNVRRYKDFS
ncbi:hypothetical protein [Dyadobacter tibetensis]|uniref:hypothetical protein n=1 Tax=Dyadobacter tibetensis TaxID=1211851 RepID=UPI0004AEA7CB|nr:hypothetical protein [Dyadobacter tibetensis]